ncbi:MAG: hypothetical protein J6O49_13035, partial [Bacteroidaceae bacterium]|nr:hypothetical protein [Bacteroidaceae bacterium]
QYGKPVFAPIRHSSDNPESGPFPAFPTQRYYFLPKWATGLRKFYTRMLGNVNSGGAENGGSRNEGGCFEG